MKKNRIYAIITGCIMAAAVFTGCGKTDEETASKTDTITAAGHLYLSVNPEIKISYNNDGLVTEIIGVNGDGKDIVSDYDNYIGKECREVASELVEEIHKAGYFVEEVEGEQKKIVIELEEGSKLPDDDFLDEISDDVSKTVAGLALGSDVVIRDDGDSNYGDSSYDSDDDSTSDYGNTDYDSDDDSTSDYGNTDYDSDDDSTSDYGNTDYDSDDDSTSDYGNTDYDSDDDSTSDYGNTDYDSDDDGQSDYTPAPTNPPATQTPAVNGDSGYDADSGYGDSVYDDGQSDYTPTNPPATQAPAVNGDSGYGNSDYGDSGYDNGASDYDNGESDYEADSDYGDSDYDD